MKKEFAEQQAVMRDLIKDLVAETLNDKLPQLLKDSPTPSAGGDGMTSQSLLTQRPSVVDQQQQILKSLQQGNINTAFQTVSSHQRML